MFYSHTMYHAHETSLHTICVVAHTYSGTCSRYHNGAFIMALCCSVLQCVVLQCVAVRCKCNIMCFAHLLGYM